jgi:hypothetical protein
VKQEKTMECKNHPGVQAVNRCAGCSEAFCANCLIEMRGKLYCGSCKVIAVQGQPVFEEATLPCKEAKEALTYAIVGIFCFGIILEPLAISKALKAKKMIETNPRLTGSGKATAALIIGIIGLLLWILGIIGRIASMNQGTY